MISCIVRLLGLKGSFLWALKMMSKGCVVRPKNITGAVKYKFDNENQGRIMWSFTHKLKDAEWINANIFMSDILRTDWEIWDHNNSVNC